MARRKSNNRKTNSKTTGSKLPSRTRDSFRLTERVSYSHKYATPPRIGPSRRRNDATLVKTPLTLSPKKSAPSGVGGLGARGFPPSPSLRPKTPKKGLAKLHTVRPEPIRCKQRPTKNTTKGGGSKQFVLWCK